jgi:hypothetical protein
MMLNFGPWLPDQPALDSPGLTDALNVYPASTRSYGPWFATQEVGNALDSRIMGAGWFRGIGGTIFGTAFTAGKAYAWDGAAWSEVTRSSGGDYATPDEDGWSLVQFGDRVIATNGTDVPQVWEVGSSANYTALGGSPDAARFVTTLRDFVLFGRVVGAQNRVYWSAINDAESYTPGTNQSDEQDIPEGGRVMGLVGGEFGTVFMERSIYRMTYQGPPLVFQFDRVSERIGCCAENSISTYEQTTYFLDFDGFYAIDGGQQIRRISSQAVDAFFWGDVNKAFLNRIVSTIDTGSIKEGNTIYIVAYPSNASTDGTPDKLMLYNATLDRWSRVEQEIDYLVPFLSNQGYNTDTIDAVIGDTDATMFLVDSSQFLGSGQAKLAAFTPNFKLATFEGDSLAWSIETQEAQIAPGQRFHVREVWPFVDGGANSVSVGYRNLPSDSITYLSDVPVNSIGFAPVNLDARFMRLKISGAAGGVWSNAQGADFVGRKSSRY